ncbi:hypothetical protein QCA50_020395 [Cerrena zonata]|uniref:DUF6534 domain-containing protein n=1 Tax=Cerrena zonata TaxID=2478898 RepID=A0AAW0FH79_9APHY
MFHFYCLSNSPNNPLTGRRVDRTWSSFHGSHAWANLTVIVANSLSAVVDGTIALMMIYFLKQNRTGVERTDNAIRWIMAYTVNSGAITMFGSIAIIIMFHAMENSLLFAGVVLVVSKLYANSLLGALNSRHLVRKKLNHQTTAITGVLTTPHFNINVFATDSSPTQSVLVRHLFSEKEAIS